MLHYSGHHCMNQIQNFDVLLTVDLSIFISEIHQIGAQNFCITISLFHASTCFENVAFYIDSAIYVK